MSIMPAVQPVSISIVRVWDVATGELRWSLKGLRASVAAVAFSRDGTRVAAAAKTTVRVWTLFEDGKPKKRPAAALKVPQGDEVTTLSFAEDGDLLVAAGRCVRKVEPTTRKVRWEQRWDRVQIVACDAMAATPGGILASVVSEIMLLDPKNGKPIWQVRGPKGLRFLAAESAGARFVGVGLLSRVQLRSVETGAELSGP
jgi:WD40 repeat protein